jgi:hypothetical protein
MYLNLCSKDRKFAVNMNNYFKSKRILNYKRAVNDDEQMWTDIIGNVVKTLKNSSIV